MQNVICNECKDISMRIYLDELDL